MKQLIIGCLVLFLTACSSGKKIYLPRIPLTEKMGGKRFFETVASWGWRQRDSLAVK